MFPTLTTVQGTRVLHADIGEEAFGALIFRVGYADETLANHGITHLLEHLVLSDILGSNNVHANGMTGPLFTSFYIRGTTQEVTSFLNSVAERLRNSKSANGRPDISRQRTQLR